MSLEQKKRLFRSLTAAGILLLFTFAGIFAIHQNGKAINEAYASSSGNNEVGFWDCLATITACLSAIAKGVTKCTEHGWISKECAQAAGAALIVCSDVSEDCNWTIPWPKEWIDLGYV